jgi:hypothetical protein
MTASLRLSAGRSVPEMLALMETLEDLAPETLLKDVGEHPVNDPGSGEVCSFRHMTLRDGMMLGDVAASALGLVKQVMSGALVVTKDAPSIPTCRECGCTDEFACDGGCEWIGPNRCSNCGMARSGIILP